MVETVLDGRLIADVQISHCAARNEPHHQLNAFTACFTHIVNVRHGGLKLGVIN